jgi:hypothetical protein
MVRAGPSLWLVRMLLALERKDAANVALHHRSILNDETY